MQQKQTRPHQHLKPLKSHTLALQSASTQQNSNNSSIISRTPSLCLPSQQALYRELVSQLGLHGEEEKMRFRDNLRDKYRRHVEMLAGHHDNHERFRQGWEKAVEEKERKKDEIRQYIESKVTGATERRAKLTTSRVKNVQVQQQKWKQIVQRNKSQYMKNIKNSMRLIKRWQNKLQHSKQKKAEILNQIANQRQQHNSYVSDICARTKIMAILEANEKVEKLQQRLQTEQREKTAAKRVKTINSELGSSRGHMPITQSVRNAQKMFVSRSEAGCIVGRSRTVGISHSSVKTNKQQKIGAGRQDILERKSQFSNRSIRQSNKKISHSSSSKLSVLDLKRSMDQEQIEKSLLKNLQKQQKIAEARNLKQYLHKQKNKLSRDKFEQVKEKHWANNHRLSNAQSERNSQLDQKYKQSRIRPIAQSRSPRQYIKKGAFSLPSIFDKGALSILQNSTPNHNSGFTSQKPMFNRLHPQRLPSAKLNFSLISQYPTPSKVAQPKHKLPLVNPETPDNSQRYNRAIMEKLRSFSLISNLKNRREFQDISRTRDYKLDSSRRQEGPGRESFGKYRLAKKYRSKNSSCMRGNEFKLQDDAPS